MNIGFSKTNGKIERQFFDEIVFWVFGRRTLFFTQKQNRCSFIEEFHQKRPFIMIWAMETR